MRIKIIERGICFSLWQIFKLGGYDPNSEVMRKAYAAFLEGDKKRFNRIVVSYLNEEE